ncbi:hypothetical protein MAIT1_01784 [Magnetofaba australis IT-1]|uniref:Uncharacterized protein n=2 Tax=Magnetofaba TaxID=1472292 RepID=A0A1Y2K140_9PROT|nr:hypothetical protein MAIT1_01784 [Magnetofaba australis IT-1]
MLDILKSSGNRAYDGSVSRAIGLTRNLPQPPPHCNWCRQPIDVVFQPE